MDEDPKAYRLPSSVRPERYDIVLDAEVDRPTFSGVVTITLDVAEPIAEIVLHANGLDIDHADIEVLGVSRRCGVAVQPQRETITLTTADVLPVGRALLRLAFSGKVSRSMEGLYLSQDGPDACLATQCEETDARAIFPCFDEPAFKARVAWQVTTSAPQVLANGALLSAVDEGEGRKTWRFEATPPMSTYLVAVCVGDFASTEERIERGVPMRVWAMRGKEEMGTFALGLTQRLLPWFEDYFGQPYHFGKYDQIAVPSFSAGAMENSGLVIFRKSLLLHDSKTTPWSQERAIARVVSHEFAHQWFGNLVTMAWWDDIWLNESFAEWVAHKALEAVAPEYSVWEVFHDGRREGLTPDALRSTHPVYSPVKTPAQATELFDTITYDKGSSVLRMLETFLGEGAFRDGLRTYMEAFAERNARGGDLWRHLAAASGHPVERIMESWLLQPGHPVVAVALTEESDEGARLGLRQSRFFATPDEDAGMQTWPVPMVIRYQDDEGVHEARHLFDAREGAVVLPTRGALRWVEPNADAIGFYRSALDDTLLDRKLAAFAALTPAEQMGTLDDQWGLVQNATQDAARFLDVLDVAMRSARRHSVVATVVRLLGSVHEALVMHGADLAPFRRWVTEGLRGQLAEVGYSPKMDDTRNDRERRTHVVRALGLLAEDPEARRRMEALADREAADPSGVDADLAGPAIAIAARFGDEARFEKNVRLYEERRASDASPEQSERYLASLPFFTDQALLTRALGLIEDERIPLQAWGVVLRSMLRMPHAREAAWRHIKKHWPVLRERVGDMWTGFLVEQTGLLDPRLRQDVVAFFDANLHGVATQSYARALERMDQRAELLPRVVPQVTAWLAKRSPDAS